MSIILHRYGKTSNTKLIADQQVPKKGTHALSHIHQGKLKFISKGEEHQKYGLSILDLIMNEEIWNSAHYMTYLALSTNTKVPKAQKSKLANKTTESNNTPKAQVKELVLYQSDDEVKADENKAEDGKAIEEQADEEQLVNEQARMEQARDEQPIDNQARNEEAGSTQAKDHAPKPATPNTRSNLTLSSARCGNKFLNENPDVSISNILKDTTEKEIQSIVDVPIHQASTIVQSVEIG
uniref:Uncharacterized protein n=1 Tax=Tanacetum cinerariifolium TaxID=118510 RepID=A0A6L2MAK9_TANCI|nr:hypothetical protein [Tanacetum cinerariifolium]